MKTESGAAVAATATAAAAGGAPDAAHTAHYSTGAAAASFTSTHMTVRTANPAAAIDPDTVAYRRVKDKGYVQLRTTLGDLNFEVRSV